MIFITAKFQVRAANSTRLRLIPARPAAAHHQPAQCSIGPVLTGPMLHRAG